MNKDVQILNNMQNQIVTDTEAEIERAADFCEKTYTREEVFDILNIDSSKFPQTDIEKQICILKLDSILSQQEADILIFHLTNHAALIREACAHKVNEFMKEESYAAFFQTRTILDSLLKAVNDINPNICRMIIEVLPYINEKEYFLENLYHRIDYVFEELEKLKRSNWYTKKLFNLYWCLEALAVIKAPADARLEKVLEKTSVFRDYTIREKTAMVLSYLSETSPVLERIKENLKNDDNFYVKRYSQQW